MGEPKLSYCPYLDSYTLMLIPLASVRGNNKVIKINLTTALNAEILYSLMCRFTNFGSDFYHSDNPAISKSTRISLGP